MLWDLWSIVINAGILRTVVTWHATNSNSNLLIFNFRSERVENNQTYGAQIRVVIRCPSWTCDTRVKSVIHACGHLCGGSWASLQSCDLCSHQWLGSPCLTAQFRKVGAWLFNPLNTQLNTICHLLALLGAYPILPINRIRVKAGRTTVAVVVGVY